jgi:hypothetical protein
MEIRTIAVASDPDLRQRYQQLASEAGATCDSVASLYELFEALKDVPYNGLLIDLATLVKAGKSEKALCHELLRLYPTLRLKWDEKSQQLRCLLYGSISHVGMSLELFLNEHCREFTARKIRRHKRMDLHYNALLSKSNNFQRLDIERSTSLDISEGGCSLLTSQRWTLGEAVWIKFIEFVDQTPIPAKICRWTPWGTPMKLPSIGVSFDSLTDAQFEQISHPGKIVYEQQRNND